MAEPQRNKDDVGEKPQWTTRQVIAFVAAIASIAGFGSSKAYDYAMSQQDVPEKKPIVCDTSVAMILGELSTIKSNLSILQTEVTNIRTESNQGYSDLREDMKLMNKRLREYERREYSMMGRE